MYTDGEKVLVNLARLVSDSDSWAPGTIEGSMLGWDCNFQRHYRVKLNAPLSNGNQLDSTLDVSDSALKGVHHSGATELFIG